MYNKLKFMDYNLIVDMVQMTLDQVLKILIKTRLNYSIEGNKVIIRP